MGAIGGTVTGDLRAPRSADTCIHDLDFKFSRLPGQLRLSLGAFRYVDHETLLYLLAVAYGSQNFELSLPTHVPSPSSSPVPTAVDFFRSWQLPEAFGLIGKDWESVLDARSLADYQRWKPIPPRYTDFRVTNAGREGLLPLSYFAITPVAISGSAAHTATIESAKHLSDHFQSVLASYIGPLADQMATVVLREAIQNAAAHPGATRVFTSSQLVKPKPEIGRPGEYVVSVWDNGRSIVDTLQAGLTDPRLVYSPAYGQVPRRFLYQVFEETARDGNSRLLRVREDELDSGTEATSLDEDTLLLASFFPGVTSDPSPRAVPPAPRPEEWMPPTFQRFSGLGLHYVLTTTVRIFGGSVSYYTGNRRLRIWADPATDRYCARLDLLAGHRPSVAGNLLVMRAPFLPQKNGG